jgi:drug/metabolite transporter (DMT)-like permease
MDRYMLSLFAAMGCALCSGTTAVLQKISADKEKNVGTLDVKLLLKLFKDIPYVIGIFLDLLGWVLTLIAVQYLPLFLVGAVVSSGIVITAFIERIFMHRRIKLKSLVSILVILFGLVLLALASSSEKAKSVSELTKYLILSMPIPIAIISYLMFHRKNQKTTVTLGVLSGMAFSGTAIVGRIFKFSHPFWHTIYSPLLLSIITSGILGLLLFSVALQRAKATVINASMSSSMTIIPAIIGISFFGDVARNDMWYMVITGISVALIGVTFLAFNQNS